MKIYRFRVLLQHGDEDIFRDLDIKSADTLKELHDIIQEAFEFDNSQMASFYLSNEEWEKGEELTLFDMNETGAVQEIRMMADFILEEELAGEGDRLLYVFDFMNVWTFHLELTQILEESKKVQYPAIVNVVGLSPEQYSKTEGMEDAETILLAALQEADQASGDLPFQDDIFEGFDDFEQF